MKYIELLDIRADRYYIIYHNGERSRSILLIYSESDVMFSPFDDDDIDDLSGAVYAMVDGRSYICCYRFAESCGVTAKFNYADDYKNGFDFFEDTINEMEVFELNDDEITDYLAYFI
jgi:hypothetical protein